MYTKTVETEIFVENRRKKLERLESMGIEAFPYEYDVSNSTDEIKRNYKYFEGKVVSIAGRIVNIREHGKVIFMDLRDFTGDIQLYCRMDNLKNKKAGKINQWELLKYLDPSDIIGVKGAVFKTKKGEISVNATEIILLSKSLYPIPYGKQKGDKRWYQVSDPEIKYRERYIYWNVYPEERKKIVIRANIIQKIREYMNSQGFLEVQTPTIEMIYGGAEARPFETEIWALGHKKAYLRISPELYLKRYIVSGFPKVYTICQNFRNEGIDKSHNPEFTMMEWYEAFTDYEFQMQRFENLVAFVVKEIHGTYEIEYQGTKLNFRPPWPRLRMVDAIKKFTGFDIEHASDEEIIDFIESQGINYEGEFNRGVATSIIFEELCEDKIIQPTFITDHPIEISPLTKVKRGNPSFVERFEPFVMGMEIGNAYSELTDPREQLLRFIEQRKLNEGAEVQHHPIDYDFIKALACGMPPTGGVGLGIDRLIMIITNSESIRDIIPFPMVKPKM